MAARADGVIHNTSLASTRPPPILGNSFCETMQRRTSARRFRTRSCSSGGYSPMIRSMLSTAELVWSVEKTLWPESVISSAADIVSGSHLADHHDVGVLAQRVDDSFLERPDVLAHLAMPHDALFR